MLLKKSYLTLVMSILSGLPLQAAFFAYQEWYNPNTGQVIEEYYDIHRGNENLINKQQQEFVADAKKFGRDLLVIGEDPLYNK